MNGYWVAMQGVPKYRGGSPPAPDDFGASSGTDADALSLPANATTGSLLILCITGLESDFPTVTGWGSDFLSSISSNSIVRIRWYSKTTAGAGSISGGSGANWAIFAINNANDSRWPYDGITAPFSNGTLDVTTGGVSSDLISITGGPVSFVCIAAGYIDAPQSGGAHFNGDPAGYTSLGSETFTYFNGLTYDAQLRIAYKVVASASSENPGTFTTDNDAYLSGGQGAMAVVVRTA